MTTFTASSEFIKEANIAYYVHGKPIMSDDQYDTLKEKFCSLHPNDPLCHSVGHISSSSQSTKVTLPSYMGSLDKIKNDQRHMDRWSKTFKGPYNVSDKLDGVSALAEYDARGTLTRLLTRGDGVTGEDATFVIKYIPGIPRKIAMRSGQPLFVRGELILPKKELLEGNLRSIVVGAVNGHKNENADILSRTHFVAYEVVSDVHKRLQLNLLAKCGFNVVWSMQLLGDVVSVDTLTDILVTRKTASLYTIDGLVVCDNARYVPVAGSNPKHMFAFKSKCVQERVECVVTRVTWEQSKDMYLIPTVCFDPITINDVVIQKAAGFHGKFIRDNGIGPGARIIVTRSGDVIPFIEKVLAPAPGGPSMPVTEFKWTDSGVDCVSTDPSTIDNPKLIAYFFAKIGCVGVAEKTFGTLFEHGFTTVKSYIGITPDKLMGIPGFQEKSANKVCVSILTALDNMSELDCMVASNVFGRGLGAKKIGAILAKVPRDASAEDIIAHVEGVGQKTAEQFVAGMIKFDAFMKNLSSVM